MYILLICITYLSIQYSVDYEILKCKHLDFGTFAGKGWLNYMYL